MTEKKEQIIKGETETGFEYQITEERLDNYELVEHLGEMEENPLVISKIVNSLLGTEQKENLKNHIRNKNGIVSSKKIGEEIKNIFESIEKAKNS